MAAGQVPPCEGGWEGGEYVLRNSIGIESYGGEARSVWLVKMIRSPCQKNKND
jgi:hypothetical protein